MAPSTTAYLKVPLGAFFVLSFIATIPEPINWLFKVVLPSIFIFILFPLVSFKSAIITSLSYTLIVVLLKVTAPALFLSFTYPTAFPLNSNVAFVILIAPDPLPLDLSV